MRKFVCLSTSLLAACSPVVAGEPHPQPAGLKSIGADVKSWGVTLHQWEMDAAGRVEHVSGGKVGVAPAEITMEVRRFTLPAASRDAIGDAVVRVKTLLATPEHCDLAMTDGPYGSFRWNEGAQKQVLPFSANCVKGRDHDLAEAIFVADRIVDDAAKAAPVAETRPYRPD